MNTRAGLRKIHANFPAIFKRLNKAYDDNLGNEKIMGGVVGIWAKMCIDSKLRDKLIEAGEWYSLKYLFVLIWLIWFS